jgi:hypothetical protein
MPVDGFLDEHDTVDTWKEHYMGLSEYKSPATKSSTTRDVPAEAWPPDQGAHSQCC